ncbi:hypothetical protein [Brevibacterium pigmentatum]|uniref:hypothetical protein n=1 Tax=Brevibacterium pigmentatum TaxID=1496080 RepID=UPI001421EFE6|nr:hypothetical protein [Brevibacterium pigmentatum]
MSYPHPGFHAALTEIPGLIGELRGYLEPGRSGTTGRAAPGAKLTAPIQLGPVDDADDLYATLREHAACIADELGTKPPTTIAWAKNRENGLPANTPPETAFAQSRTLARFIEHQLPMVRDNDLTESIQRDIIKRWLKATKKYPAEAPRQHLPVRCIACEVMLVYMHPPRSFGFDETFVCESCGRWHTETEIAEQRLQHRAEQAAKGRAA